MKSIILKLLGISLIFVGLGTVVDQVGARFKSDEKALDIIRKARTAIGGDGAIAGVRSFVIKGQTSKTVSVNGAEKFEQGETEIAFESPNKIMKMTKIGDHGADADAIVDKTFDVVVVGAPGDGPHKVIVEGKDGEFTSESGDKVKVRKIDGEVGETKVFVRKKVDGEVISEDADVKEVTTADGKKFTIVRKGGDGAGEWKAEDGKKMTFERTTDAAHGGVRNNELLRLTLSLLLTAPEGMDVTYTFAGETTVDGSAANAVLASFGGSDVKLYFDRHSNLPLAMSYVGHPSPIMMTFRKVDASAPPAGDKDVVTFERKLAGPEAKVEHFVRFGDYRSTNGLLLPYKWTTSVAGKQSDVFDVSSYEINPANIGDRFKGNKVMVRTKKATEK